MISVTVRRILSTALVASLTACGGGGSGTTGSATGNTQSSQTSQTTQSQTASVPLVMTDASSEDWATIGVKILSIALTPQGGGAAVIVYTAPTPAPMVNLEQLDQIGEILGNGSVPVGTYTGALLTVSANPGDVALTVAADPETGFPVAPGTAIASSAIQIQHTQGAAPNLTVPVNLTFDSPLVVSTSQSNALDLEFDLGHPAFIVGHTPPGAGQTLWAVNFNGPVRRQVVNDITHLVLRHLYGTVTTVANDGSSITVTKDLPALPPTSPETAVATSQSIQILADSINGTIFYDVDAKTSTTIKSFSSESSLAGKYVRVASRYQADGTLVAVRVWASSQFNSVWVSPEGHVLHVDKTSDVVTIANESGSGVPVTVNSNTQFFFRTPWNAVADATPIATGTAFLTNQDLVRGFKVHVSVVDPLATPLLAQTVDIETAAYDGKISGANSTGFAYTRNFRTASDDYNVTLNYISATTPNGVDSSGNPVTGFKWWDFTYPTLATTGSDAVSDFVAATNGSVTFGTNSVTAWGATYALWNDPASAGGWSAPMVVVEPTPLPLGLVSAGFANNSFTMTAAAGGTPDTAATVDVSTTTGSAALVYQVDRTNGVVTVSPIDVTTSAGLSAITSGLVNGAPVKVYGVPQSDGTLKAYVILYYTGDAPTPTT